MCGCHPDDYCAKAVNDRRTALEFRGGRVRAGLRTINVPISFSTARDFDEWPTEVFDVVCLIDVVHHVAKACQQDFYRAAAARVQEGGLLLYKDMATHPWWCALGNRLHDLVLARQWIAYYPRDHACAALASAGMTLVYQDQWRKYWYAHEFAVFRKTGAAPPSDSRYP